MKKELKRNEDLIETNKNLLEEYKKKASMNSGSNETNLKFMEIENKIKELNNKELVDLKGIIREKENNIENLNKEIEKYRAKLGECLQQVELLTKKTNEVSIEDIKLREEKIAYYEDLLNTREVKHQEELHEVSTILYGLGLQYFLEFGQRAEHEGGIKMKYDSRNNNKY